MPTLRDVLSSYRVDDLRPLCKGLSLDPYGRKDDLVDRLWNVLSSSQVTSLWPTLSPSEQTYMAECLYAPGGVYEASRLRAKHGRLVRNGVGKAGGLPFLCEQDGFYFVPSDLIPLLKPLAVQPQAHELIGSDSAPAHWDDEPLVQRLTEQEALLELPVLLRLVDRGGLKVSEKTARPSAACMNQITAHLTGGDFYLPEMPTDEWQQIIGPIKAFAWPMLLQGSGLVAQTGGKQGLTAAGRKALAAAPADTLRQIWSKWLKAKLLDEFSRIDDIKGQKAGNHMSAVPPRRETIAAALGKMPVGRWLSVDELSRYMQVHGLEFAISHNPWKLYLADPSYGSLGYDGSGGWNILQLRYLLCFLMEYVAPLGMLDLAYRSPQLARRDFRSMWGADNMEFLSRYDGLSHIRLTALGAYCLGLCDHYQPPRIESSLRLTTLPSLNISVASGTPSAEERLLLETWTQATSEQSWHLERSKLLDNVSQGRDIEELRQFLADREDQDLPDSVDTLFKTCARQGKAVKPAGSALLMECVDVDTASQIAQHKETAPYCLLAGKKTLVVRPEHEAKFRAQVRVLGFGVLR